MEHLFIGHPQLASKAVLDKGFIAFFDRNGKCIGRRDTDYLEPQVVNTVEKAGKRWGPWVQSMYLDLIWKPLVQLGNLNMPEPQ